MGNAHNRRAPAFLVDHEEPDFFGSGLEKDATDHGIVETLFPEPVDPATRR